MPEVNISATTRTEFGKGASRRDRRAGRVPAVLYGHGTDARHLTLPARELTRALKSGGANTVLTLQLDGTSELALPKVVVRDALRDDIEHIDLLLVRRGEKVTVDVRVVVTGEPAPGTLVLTDSNTLSVEVDALNIPESIEVSVAGADTGLQILAKDVALPEGAVLVTDPESLVVGVSSAPTAEDLDEDALESGAAVEDAPADAENPQGDTATQS